MASEAVKRFAQAKQAVEKTLVDPITELLESVNAVVGEARQQAKDAKEVLEELRPVWAQGWTDDSAAAQASAGALAQIWKELGVTNQTEAMEKVRKWKADQCSI